ncbi:MAG: hypothetical protein Q7R41_13245, partial [Phycisphaerales bacterium]|nr:hypothetical protein [Phycisphaerales bacterium]
EAVIRELGYELGSSDASLGAIAAAKPEVHRVPIEITWRNRAGLAAESVRQPKSDAAKSEPRKTTRDYPCLDRISVAINRDGTAGKCCDVYVLMQRGFPKSAVGQPGGGSLSPDRFEGGWIVADAAVYRNFFDRLAAKVVPPPAQ